MNTQPITPELRQWLMEQQAANLPAVRQPVAPVPVSRMFPELHQPQPVVVQQPAPDPWVWRPLAAGASCTLAGAGIWLAGLGIRAVGSVSLWAVAAMFISTAVIRVLAPKRTGEGGRRTTIIVGSHNHIGR